eukprot:TRINITY_DN15005_c0_g1_i1.p1 TRINITY_DN15005_c0_g1~~TRINITY_DN15005_c0_g1_i1.p1  ORF type:complete len:178 (-),score=25.53 TRINITY_DN15005_c0_g1_i1:66-599(-)
MAAKERNRQSRLLDVDDVVSTSTTRITPNNEERDKAKAYAQQAKQKLAKGHFNEAVKDAELALQTDPRNPLAHYVLGVVCRFFRTSQQNNNENLSLERAIRHLTLVAQIEPQSLTEYPNLYYHLGIANEYLSKHKEALQCYNRALELDPKSQKARIKIELYHIYLTSTKRDLTADHD